MSDKEWMDFMDPVSDTITTMQVYLSRGVSIGVVRHAFEGALYQDVRTPQGWQDIRSDLTIFAEKCLKQACKELDIPYDR